MATNQVAGWWWGYITVSLNAVNTELVQEDKNQLIHLMVEGSMD